MYRGKNKFEVMYSREQVNYEAENIMELLISHIIYVYWSYFNKTNVISSKNLKNENRYSYNINQLCCMSVYHSLFVLV
jgi:hypothetical protein